MTGNRAGKLAAIWVAVFCLCLGAGAAWAGGDFRKDNDLVTHQPPDWFLKGGFVACETGPRYIFGSVSDFVGSLGCPTAWLVEPEEQARVDKAAQAGKTPEYSLYLEQDAPGGKVYWMFVVLPHQDPQQWFSERHDYHKTKTEGYYGKTLEGMKMAQAQGMSVKGELRFKVVGGEPSMDTPEKSLLAMGKPSPLFDLQEGRVMGASQK